MLQIFSQRHLMFADETVYKEWEDRMERAATTASSLEAEFEAASKQSNDPPLSRVNTLGSGEDSMKLKELMTAQTKEITNLKLRVKKLEKKAGFRTHNFKRLYKVGVTRRVESSNDESLGAQEDASK
ncbi:hypothetical protein Tco_0716954 [Tanacetum coccineum]